MTVRLESTRRGESHMPVGATFQSALQLASIAGCLGLAVEVLFFGHRLGISFFIWALLSVCGLLLAARLHRVRMHAGNVPLVSLILFFAAMVFLRRDPFTLILDVLLTLALFGLLIRSFWEGDWLEYGAVEYLLSVVWTPIQAWLLPWGVLRRIQEAMAGGGEVRRKGLAILRGFMLAIPVLAVLISLLSSADLVFRDELGQILAWMDLENVFEVFGRLLLIVGSGLFSLGALTAALRPGGLGALRGHVDRFLRPFLGWIEAIIVLGLVDGLFAAFVLIQFRYLFGGESQIAAAGYTYAEYARRGFGELMVASVFSLGLIMALATWVRIDTRVQGFWFNGLNTLLVIGVGGMLASSLVRLLAYEGAYGFTRLRTYSHLAILWIGALFLGFLILLLAGWLQRVPLVVTCVVVGYAGSLNLVAVDNFVVRQNMGRYLASGEIDMAYLTGLSTDAVPGLVSISANLSPARQEDLLPQLACRARVIDDRRRTASWPEYDLSSVWADQALDRVRKQLEPYRVTRESDIADGQGEVPGNLIVRWPGGEEMCRAVYDD
jgi:hypothetical protein